MLRRSRPGAPSDRAARSLVELLDDATWRDALTEPSVLRRRLILAEILAPALALRADPRDLRMPHAGSGRGR